LLSGSDIGFNQFSHVGFFFKALTLCLQCLCCVGSQDGFYRRYFIYLGVENFTISQMPDVLSMVEALMAQTGGMGDYLPP
jgi:hypothetical protein